MKYNMVRMNQKFVLALLSILCFQVLKAQQNPIEVDNGYKIAIQTSAICEMCQFALEKDLAFEKGVKTATLNLDDKVMTIIYNPKKTDPQTLRKRITKVGYHADTLYRDELAYDRLPMCCKDGSHGTPIPQLPIQKKQKE